MFERYTEKARRAIFFARYETSQFGSPSIEAEHLLLGLLREDQALAKRFLRSPGSNESIRKQIEARTPVREKVSTSVDLPLSDEAKRALHNAAEEADRLSHKHIGTEHLLLGLLREKKSFAAQILRERGLRLSKMREELARVPQKQVAPQASRHASLLSEFGLDLTEAAAESKLDPLVGRENELERVVQVLCRRIKNNPVLVGEPGVGKAAIVKGLAQRIVDGSAPAFLGDKRIVAIYLNSLMAGSRRSGRFEERLNAIVKELAETANVVAFIEDLYAPEGSENSLDAARILRPALSLGDIQCIASATPSDCREAVKKEPWLERCFNAIPVPPPDKDEALKILSGVKGRYEEFHGVTYADEALKSAVDYSERYLPTRYLPDKAIDLMDEAGTRVKLRQVSLPEEIVEVQKRLKFLKDREEIAIANHEFQKAKFYLDEESKERGKLQQLRKERHIDETVGGTVTREDIEAVVARWTGVPVASIRQDFVAGQDKGEDKVN